MEHLDGQPAAGAPAAAKLDDDALNAIRYGWGDAYDIGYDQARGYWARRRDGLGGDITADSPDAIWQAILDDYTLKPVPRDFGPPPGNPR
ncbi:MAG TPA: hypothetical protein VMI73_01310 [Trebonia sp.]|nr:hypothetical protein [Trebonia sp.]